MLSVASLSGVRGLGLAEEGEAGQRSSGPVKIPFSLLHGRYVMARRMGQDFGGRSGLLVGVCVQSSMAPSVLLPPH